MLSLLLVLAAPAAARAAGWQRPVDGPLLRAFDLGENPYERGRHRGVDLVAAQGSRVRSACSGRVSFAGSVPNGGRTVSVRCGALIATYQQLGAIHVPAGRRVARGSILAVVGRSGDPRARRAHLHLGVRVAASGRYLDPLMMLSSAPPAVPLPGPSPAPRPRRRSPPPVARAPLPVPRLAPQTVPRLAPLPRPAGSGRQLAPKVPWFVWAGLAGAGLALPVGGLVAARRPRRSAARRPSTAVRRA